MTPPGTPDPEEKPRSPWERNPKDINGHLPSNSGGNGSRKTGSWIGLIPFFILAVLFVAVLMFFVPEPTAQDGYLVKAIILIALLLLGFRGFSALGFGHVLRMVAGWLLIVGALAGLYMLLGRGTSQPEFADFSGDLIANSDGSYTIRRSKDGHFWLPVRIDGVLVTALVDTGATHTVLTIEDAHTVGLNPNTGGLTVTSDTANGVVKHRMMGHRALNVGKHSLGNVPISVGGPGLSVSLFGMSSLARFQSLTIETERLIFRP